MKRLFGFAMTNLLLYLLVTSTAYSQSDLRFEHLSERDGLSQNSVLGILQDREGFMWFGTLDGLNQYNGYTFTTFKADPRTLHNTLRHNFINDLHEDKTGRLWVATGIGLHLLDKQSGKITAYLIDPTRMNSDYLNRYLNMYFSIYEDHKGLLWLNAAAGVNQFNPTTGKFISYLFHDIVVLLDLTEDAMGRFWVATAMGLYLFEPKSGKFTPFSLDDTSSLYPEVSTLYIDEKGILWIGTQEEGIFHVDTKHTPLKASRYNPGRGVNKNINQIHDDASGYLWLATSEGLQRIHKQTQGITTYRSNPSLPGTLSSNNVLCVYQDRTGNLWVGTDNGINKAIAHPKSFYSYQITPTFSSVRLYENNIQSVVADQTGSIWLGTEKGLYQLNSHLEQLAHFPVNPADSQDLSTNWVKALYEDRMGRLWVGTGKGLQLLDRPTGQFIRYPFESVIYYTHMDEDASGKLWIGGIGDNSVISFDPTNKQYFYYKANPQDPTGLKDNYVWGIMASRKGDIWLATGTWGASRLNPQTGKFTHYLPNYHAPAGHINDKNSQYLYEDREGIIWVGTEQGGLNRYDPKTNNFTNFTTHEGLSSNFVVSMIEDGKGNLWMGTNKGISRFNPKTQTFRNFDVGDGLPDNEFRTGAVFSHNGRLFFGSANGLVMFYPDSIQENILAPPIHITGFNVLEKPQPIPSGKIELSHRENFLSFEFVALNYNSPEKNQYAYQLEGLEPDWIKAGTRRYASYTDLDPGTYTFRVKGSNNDGVWNEKGVSLRIIIHPPWWRSIWAYGFYGLCLIAGVYAVDRFQRRRLIEKEREKARERELAQARELEKAYKQLGHQKEELQTTLEDLQATQTQLIQSEKMASLGELTAGIAHEIQNPLNFVNNFSEVSQELCGEIEEETNSGNTQEVLSITADLKQNLEKIHHHGKRADAIVKSMLQHSRSSSGEKQPTDINTLVDEYLRLAYHGLRAKDKDFNADFSLDADPSVAKIEVIPQEIGRVLLNLFNNAFYATNQKKAQLNGQYHPQVMVSTKTIGDKLEISIRDNGIGIPEAMKSKIFQPFFTTKPTGEGTGLGLSLSYDIIKGHQGELKVESREGEYTEFIILLPASK